MTQGMSLIIKTITRLVTSFITLFGIYIVLYGHVSPGGGLAGGVILSAGMMLTWLGERNDDAAAIDAAKAIDSAVARVLSDPANHTPDLGGEARTPAVGDAVASEI